MKNLRINLEVPHVYRDRLKALQKETNSSSQSEVFRKSIELMEIATKAKSEGSEIKIVKPNGEIQTLIILV